MTHDFQADAIPAAQAPETLELERPVLQVPPLAIAPEGVSDGIEADENRPQILSMDDVKSMTLKVFSLYGIVDGKCGDRRLSLAEACDEAGLLPAILRKAGSLWSEMTGEQNPVLLEPEMRAFQGYALVGFALPCIGTTALLTLDIVEELDVDLDNVVDLTPIFADFERAPKNFDSPVIQA